MKILFQYFSSLMDKAPSVIHPFHHFGEKAKHTFPSDPLQECNSVNNDYYFPGKSSSFIVPQESLNWSFTLSSTM